MLLKTSIIIIFILLIIDLASLLGGYYKFPLWYWLADESGIISFFTDEQMYLNHFAESQKNSIMTYVQICFLWSIIAILSGIWFLKNRYKAASLPFTLWKLSTIMMAVRFILVTMSIYRFHFVILPEILDLSQSSMTTEYLIQLYQSGTIGMAPISLIGSLILNFSVFFTSLKCILKNQGWRELNIHKIY